jgi:hypothetical protein
LDAAFCALPLNPGFHVLSNSEVNRKLQVENKTVLDAINGLEDAHHIRIDK